MRRRTVPLLVIVMLVAIAAPAAPALADDFVAISATVASPDPGAGDPFTVVTTVSNGAESDTGYFVESIRLRRGKTTNSEVLTERSVGQLIAPGDALDLNVSATLEETGTHTVYVHVTLVGDSRRRVVQPVTVEVYDPHPQVSISTGSVPGDRQRLSVSVSNGLDRPIQNVEVVVDGAELDVRNPRRVTAAVGAGVDRSFAFEALPPADGTAAVDVTVRYTLDGQRRTYTATYTADFSEASGPADRPQVSLDVQQALPGASRSVNVTVANGRDRPMNQVRVLVSSPTADFGANERVLATLQAGVTETFRFPATVAEAGTHRVNVTIAYTDAGVRQRVSRTFRASFDAPQNPGAIRLTSVEAIQRGSELELSATASNVGGGPAQAVIVSVNDTGAVEPADYFVGSVEGSDFASFTITTEATGNVSAVPVTVTYVVGGVERSFSTEIPVTRVAVDPPDTGGGGPPWLPIAGAVVLLVIVGVLYRRRG